MIGFFLIVGSIMLLLLGLTTAYEAIGKALIRGYEKHEAAKGGNLNLSNDKKEIPLQ